MPEPYNRAMTTRPDLKNHHTRRAHIAKRMATVERPHRDDTAASIREPVALVRREIGLAREYLQEAQLPHDAHERVATALNSISRSVFAKRDFLGGVRTAIWKNARGEDRWSIFCWSDVATGKPDAAKFDHIQSRIDASQTAITEARTLVSQLKKEHRDHEPATRALVAIGKGLESLQVVMVQSARSITHFAREDGMTR